MTYANPFANWVDPNADLIRDYADLGVSCGYIGGVHIWGDDRSFMVFTHLRWAHGSQRNRANIVVFDVPYGHKGTWKSKVEFDTPEVRAKLDRFRALVAEGKLIASATGE